MPAVSSLAALSLSASPTSARGFSAGDSDAFSSALDRAQSAQAKRSVPKAPPSRTPAEPAARSGSSAPNSQDIGESDASTPGRPLADDAISTAMPDRASVKVTSEVSEPLAQDGATDPLGTLNTATGDIPLTSKASGTGLVAETAGLPGKVTLDPAATTAISVEGDNPGTDTETDETASLAPNKALAPSLADTAENAATSKAALIEAGSRTLTNNLPANLALAAMPRKLDPAIASLLQGGAEEVQSETSEVSGAEPGTRPGVSVGNATANTQSLLATTALPGLTGTLTGTVLRTSDPGSGSPPQADQETASGSTGSQFATQIAAQSADASSGQANPPAPTAAALAAAVGPSTPGPAAGERPDTVQSMAGSHQGTASLASAETAATSFVNGPSLAAIETTAQLALQIARRVEGRTTRFEMALTPEGLGRVDIRLDIDAEGRLSARLAFDNPAAATELRGRADELRRQLQEAGFNVGSDSLSFSERETGSSPGGSDRRSEREAERAFAGASRLTAEVETSAPPPAWTSFTQTPQGVDLKV